MSRVGVGGRVGSSTASDVGVSSRMRPFDDRVQRVAHAGLDLRGQLHHAVARLLQHQEVLPHAGARRRPARENASRRGAATLMTSFICVSLSSMQVMRMMSRER